jgi:hypothetical protein
VPTIEQEIAQRAATRNSIAELLKESLDGLARRGDLGEQLNFVPALPHIERMLNVVREADASLDRLPNRALGTIQTIVSQVQGAVNEFKNFSVDSTPNPAQKRNQLIETFRKQSDAWFETLIPFIAYGLQRDADTASAESRVLLAELRDTLRQAREEREKSLREIEETVAAAKRASAEVGVSQYSGHFQREAEGHRKAGRNWLIATALIGAVGLAAAGRFVWFYSTTPVTITATQSVQLAVAKIAFLSLIYFAMIAAAGVYRAHRHNYTVNVHRANALGTFEAFVKAATDEQTKNAVLLQATHSIFAPQLTGYLGKDSEPQGAPQILEIMRGTAGKGTT